MEVILLGSKGALVSSESNLDIEMSDDLRSFLLAWRGDIDPISLTSELY